jgi:F0F1-type ATP synthase assembly protein I
MTKLENTNSNEIWWNKPLALFSQMSAWIGFPVIGAVFLGQWLDERYQTKPWLFLLTVGLAFIISMVGIIRIAIQSINEIDNNNSHNNIKDNKND